VCDLYGLSTESDALRLAVRILAAQPKTTLPPVGSRKRIGLVVRKRAHDSHARFPCSLPNPRPTRSIKSRGRIYSRVMVNHYPRFTDSRARCGCRNMTRMKLTDFYEAQDGRKDSCTPIRWTAAQEGFYKACKTAKACNKLDAQCPLSP